MRRGASASNAASPPVPTVSLADDPEGDARYAPEAPRQRWPAVLALICLLAIGLGVFVYLQPDLATSLVDNARAQVTTLIARYG